MNSTSRLSVQLLLLSLVVACEPDGNKESADDTGAAPPTVLSKAPSNGATDVAVNESVSAIFSVPMGGSSLSTGTFTLSAGDPAVLVDGTVIYADSEAVFWPASHLASDTLYTATITTDAESADGVGLEAEATWSFTTGDWEAPGLAVNLGAAGSFAVFAKSGISTVPSSNITGDIGVSPAAASFITGFSLTADATNVYSTSTQVTGKVYAADYAPPTPANLTAAVGDMELAYTDSAGRAPDYTELNAGDIGGMTLESGVYRWGTGLLVPTDLTLEGDATAVWIFQVAQNLTLSNGTEVVLTGGALPENVLWQVAGLVSVGTTAHLEGTVLTQTSITLGTGASVNGRLLAQTSVDIDSTTVVAP